MDLDYEVPALEPLAENIRGLYKPKEDGQGYVLSVKGGVVPKTKVDEFRNKNVELAKELEKFKDVDPEKYKHILQQQKDLEEGELLRKGDVDGLVNKRVAAIVTEKDSVISARDEELSATRRMLESITINDAVKSSSLALGVLPEAIDDVILRARTTFVIEKGKTVARDAEGNPMFASDGTTPLTVQEWTKQLKAKAPHLFQGVQGTNAGGGRQVGGRDVSKMTATEKISAGLAQARGA
jgi:hypothetical protein